MIVGNDCSLSAYVDRYAVQREISDSSVYQLRRSALIFERWAGEPIDVGAITDDQLSRWLYDLRNQYAQATLRKIRGDVLTLLRDAAEAGLCDPPKRVRKIARPKPNPQAWSASEVAVIIEAATRLRGVLVDGRRRADYFSALFLAAWETGLRRSDLFRLRQRDIGDGGRIVLTQKKTGDAHVAHVRPDTVARLRRLGDTPLSWPSTNRLFYYWFDKVVAASGVPPHGGLHCIRASGATDVALHQPGRQTRFLGHTTPAADSHYLDRRIIEAAPIMPTEIVVRELKQQVLF